LLNLKGEVVGINTAIITTSGSSAGIGFAVPSDQIQPVVDQFIRQDRIDRGQRPNPGWLGVSIIQQDFVTPTTSTSTSTMMVPPIPRLVETKNWIFSIEQNSPASIAGLQPITITQTGIVQYGDAIVAVGGNAVTTYTELVQQFEDRVVGEQITLTVENAMKERRVVYVTLSRRKTND
jgi:S1-C subfamily serine protease